MKRLTACWVLLLLTLPQVAFGASAKVVRLEGKTVEIDIGATRGIELGMRADVLTEAGGIVHPVTGEDYGAQRVKIGELEIREVRAETAIGQLMVVYAPVKVGDIVDGLIAIPSAEERMLMDIDEARAEIKALARSLADEIKNNQKAIEDLRRTLQRIGSSERRLRSVMNAVQNMRERMVVIESRVVTLEEQQATIAQDTAEVDVLGKLNVSDLGVLERGGGEEIFLRVGDRTYRLNFEANRMDAVAPSEMDVSAASSDGAPSLDEPIDDLFGEEGETEGEGEGEAETPWYMAWWFLGAVFAVIGLAAGAAVLMLKKKKGDSASPQPEMDADDDVAADGFEELDEDEIIEDLPDDLPELEPAEEDT